MNFGKLVCRNNKDVKVVFTLAFIAIVYFLFAVSHTQVRALNVDDMAQIYFTRPGISISEMWMRYRELLGDAYPPLLQVLTACWLRIAPFGAGWLKLPSIVMVSAGIFICGICGFKLKDAFTGILSSILAATSYTLLMESSFSFRAYGLLFLAMSLVLCAFILRNQIYLYSTEGYKEKNSCLFVYAATMLIAGYTHYFAVIFCGFLFIMDFVWIIRKKMHPKILISYLLTGILYAPWLIFGVIPAMGKYTQGFWPVPPTLESITDLYIFLVGGNNMMAFLATVSFLTLIFALGRKVINKTSICHFSFNAPAISSFLTVLVVYCYSTQFPSSIFVNRYFIVLVPTMIVLMAAGISSFTDYLFKIIKWPEVYSGLCVLLMAFLVFNNYTLLAKQQEPYLDASIWLREQDDIYKEDTLLLTTYVNEDGFNYFITENWSLQLPEAISIRTVFAEPDILDEYNKIYVITDFAGKPEIMDSLMNNSFYTSLERADLNLEVYVRK